MKERTKKGNPSIKHKMRKNLQNLCLHSEQVRQKQQNIEVVCVCVCSCVCVCVCVCSCVQKAFFLYRVQRRISIESKIKGSGKK